MMWFERQSLSNLLDLAKSQCLDPQNSPCTHKSSPNWLWTHVDTLHYNGSSARRKMMLNPFSWAPIAYWKLISALSCQWVSSWSLSFAMIIPGAQGHSPMANYCQQLWDAGQLATHSWSLNTSRLHSMLFMYEKLSSQWIQVLSF